MKIAVLFGGDSMERDVSMASAAQVVGALRSRGHDVLAVDSGRGRLAARGRKKAPHRTHRSAAAGAHGKRGSLPTVVSAPDLQGVDLVFVALHGGSGEDGTIQALLDLASMPYTGSGRLGSAVGWDKDIAKRLFLAAGVPTPDWLMAPLAADVVSRGDRISADRETQRTGIDRGADARPAGAELRRRIELAASFDSAVMIERYVPGRELTVGVLDDRALAVGEIIPTHGPIFDYAAKYQTGGAEEIFPADLTPEQTARAQDFALRVHRALKLESLQPRRFPDGR